MNRERNSKDFYICGLVRNKESISFSRFQIISKKCLGEFTNFEQIGTDQKMFNDKYRVVKQNCQVARFHDFELMNASMIKNF